jgi:hypothetical protein
VVSHPVMRHLKSFALAIMFTVSGGSAFALEISYGGRLADEMGAPLTGSVELVFSFYDAAEGGSRLVTLPRRNVSLADGVFQVSLELTAAETEALFGDGDRSVFIEVQQGSRVFPRQKFSYVPLALRVPVDGNRIVYDSQGRLTLSDGALGDLNLGSRATLGLGRYSNAEQGTLVAAFSAGDKGKTWYNTDTGEIKYFNGTAVVTMPTSGGSSGNLSDTLVRKSGDTMSGPLAMGAQKITGLGTPTDANDASSKGYVDGHLGGYPLDQQAKGPGSVIKWDSVNQKFVFAADQVDTTGSGMASLNGLGVSSQSLAVSVTGASSGTKPDWISANSSHALVFPMASESGVSAGLLSKTSFDSFSAKQSAITPSSVVALGTVTTALQRGVEILPYASSAGATGELRLRELGGSDYVGFKSPDAVPSNTIWTLPSSDGPGGYVLGTNGSGALSWISPTEGAVTSIVTGTGLTGGPILGAGTISLATVGTEGTYTKVTTNPQGQVTGGSSLTDADIPSLNAAKITSGTLSVALGGTGATSFTNNGVLVGSGSSPLSATLAGAQYQVLRAEAGGAPAFGAISLNQSAAVSGVLPLINGGTGAATSAGARTNLGLGSAATLDTGTSANNVVQLDGTAKLPAVDGTQLTGVVKIAGDTMTGALRLPPDGLAVGGSQLMVNSGNVGIGSTTPGAKLDVEGGARFRSQNALELLPYSSLAGNTSELRFDELAANGTNFVGFKAPDTLAGDVIWTLPNVMGTSGQVLSAGASGVLSWTTPPSAPVTTVAGRTGAVTLSSTDISGLSSLATDNAVSGGTGGTITDDSITNADINSTAAIADSKLATISSAGKVTNSATTATSASTANAIVARDASGNFTAGTITATLNGNATNVIGTVALSNGGTGATTAEGARTNLGAAASGANWDITSLTGLTTALSIAQGGTGATSAANARTNLGAAASGANTDITSLANLTSLNTTGNVGIGSGTPSFRLDVATSGAGIQTIERLQNTVTAANNSGAQTMYSANRTTNGLTDVAAVGGTITDISASAYKGALVFSTANNAAPAERMRIDSNGNVGIGTTSPGARVEVLASGTSRVLLGDGYPPSANVFGGIGLGITSFSGTNYSMLGNGASTWINAPSDSILFAVGNNVKMSVLSSGNVGMGTTTPSAKLEVSGSIKQSACPSGQTKVYDNYCIDSSDRAAATMPAAQNTCLQQGGHACREDEIIAACYVLGGASITVGMWINETTGDDSYKYVNGQNCANLDGPGVDKTIARVYRCCYGVH